MVKPKVKPGQVWRARNGAVVHVEKRNEHNKIVAIMTGKVRERGLKELFPFDLVDLAFGVVATCTTDGTEFADGSTAAYDLVEYLGEAATLEAEARKREDYATAVTGKPIENPTDPAWLTFLDTVDRKTVPLATGLFDYFPDALAAVAHCSHVAQAQHGGGGEVAWDRSISPDHDNTLLRHFSQRGTVDTDGVRHRAKVAWRALAALQIEIEKDLNNGG